MSAFQCYKKIGQDERKSDINYSVTEGYILWIIGTELLRDLVDFGWFDGEIAVAEWWKIAIAECEITSQKE